MNSGLQPRMYNYEVAPPAGLWEKIASELDESELSQTYPSRLHHLEVPPPVHAWQGIAAALDEPGFVQDYAAKLTGIELAPPAAVWNKIKNSLDAEHETVIPATRRIAPWIKYAAAAVVTGLLAWGGFRIFDNKTAETGLAKKETITPVQNTPSTNDQFLVDKNVAVTDINASIDEARNEAALEASKKTYAKLETRQQSKIKNAASFYFSAPEEDEYTLGTTRSIDPAAIMPGLDIANRYILLMTPDGNIIRMSKKLSELVCCVSGEDEDKDCVDQMKKWREKMANPSSTHTPGNFMDLLHLVNSLQDN